jgi:hypothetical protein
MSSGQVMMFVLRQQHHPCRGAWFACRRAAVVMWHHMLSLRRHIAVSTGAAVRCALPQCTLSSLEALAVCAAPVASRWCALLSLGIHHH